MRFILPFLIETDLDGRQRRGHRLHPYAGIIASDTKIVRDHLEARAVGDRPATLDQNARACMWLHHFPLPSVVAVAARSSTIAVRRASIAPMRS